MYKLFDEAIKQIKIKKGDPTVDSWVFNAMKGSMVISLFSCLLCTLKTYIGDNINCITDLPKDEHKAVETYCFISSTYSMINLTEGSPHYGIGPHVQSDTDDDLKMHSYYQWVPFVLALQSSAYYFPRWLWKKVFDKKKFHTLLGGLHAVQLLEKVEVQKNKHVQFKQPSHIVSSADYMSRSLRTHTGYALQFLFCEILSFSIALGNLFFTNAFLGGDFWQYGSTAFSYINSDVTDMNNPLNQVFPKVTKCLWYKYGPSGTIQTHDALCVLPLNIVNEKTFIILWFVYIITLTVVSAVLLVHILSLLIPKLRNKITVRRIRGYEEKRLYNELSRKFNYGDWFVVNQMSKRMVDSYFVTWLKVLNERNNK